MRWGCALVGLIVAAGIAAENLEAALTPAVPKVGNTPPPPL
jgi:hypothetical protein